MHKVVLSYTALTKPLKTARMALKEVWQKIDSYFFMEDGSDSDVKPYFYGSIGFITAVMFFLFVAIR